MVTELDYQMLKAGAKSAMLDSDRRQWSLTQKLPGLPCIPTYHEDHLMPSNEKSQISLRLPAQMVAAFDRIAQVLERDRTWVMQKALNQYLTNEGTEILRDADGLDELDRGESVDLDDVIEKARMIVDAAELRHRRVG
jgi:predicted transcriptional regulator